MKKSKLLLAALLMCASSIASAASLKVGFVNVEQLLSNAPQVKDINDAMSKRFSDRNDKLIKSKEEIQALQEEFKRNELVMTDDKLTELRKKMISKVQKYKQGEQILGKQVNEMRSKEFSKLQKLVRGIIKDLAKKEKFDLVLSEGVVFATDKLNITDKVLKKMESKHKKSK